ncbi:MAG: rhomboid family intramembrane serine protease [Verrucomicrobia bacterium]|nr:rhomboid family intramembrane serine protease [Verrucomicrobiota bacterium]
MRLSGRKTSRFTRSWSPAQRVVLLGLLGLNVAGFLAQLVLSAWDASFAHEYLGLSHRGVSQAYAWQFFTALLLHNNVWHFAADMLVLYFIGRDVEVILGRREFIFLYLFGAFAGELGHLFLMPADCVLFAASGGVAALFMAYATILPELEVTTLLLFMVPLRLKMRRLAQLSILVAGVLVIFDRSGTVGHSAFLGGAAAGWLYAHVLGFGRTSFLQRTLWRRRSEAERLRNLPAEQFLAEQIDPVLEKISDRGLRSLTRRERRLLQQAREKMLGAS